MSTFSKVLDAVVGALERAVTACFLVLAALLVLLVTLRYLFNTTIIGGDEIAGILFVYTTAFGAAVGVARDTHIRLSVLPDRLPPRGRRVVAAVNAALVLVLHAALLATSIGWIRQVGGFETPVLNLPQWVGQVAVPGACALVVAFCTGRLAILAGGAPDRVGAP